jgi:hypothetical protein
LEILNVVPINLPVRYLPLNSGNMHSKSICSNQNYTRTKDKRPMARPVNTKLYNSHFQLTLWVHIYILDGWSKYGSVIAFCFPLLLAPPLCEPQYLWVSGLSTMYCCSIIILYEWIPLSIKNVQSGWESKPSSSLLTNLLLFQSAFSILHRDYI